MCSFNTISLHLSVSSDLLKKSYTRCKCGESPLSVPKGRIVGGEKAKPDEFPWQAGLIRRERPYCAGCLINDRYVMTAGHCVEKYKPRTVFVVLGHHNFADSYSNYQKYAVSKFYLHPKYNSDMFLNDIALVKLSEPIEMSKSRKPPCFARPDLNYTGHLATVSGWGRTSEQKNSPGSDQLRKVNLPVISLYRCRLAFGANVIPSSNICAGWHLGKKDSCAGDSGSALVTKLEGRWYVIGIVSWGFGCARPDYPAVHTRVDKFYQWIDKHTKDAKYCLTY